MYSYRDRLKAVKLYIKFSLSIADTIRELGYPSRNMLRQWYQEYTETGEHGHNMARTIKAIGYPHRKTMREWVHELAPMIEKFTRRIAP